MMAPFSQFLGDSRYWGKKRWEYLEAARECRVALTKKGGGWEYEPTDERVKAAMRCWVDRARNAHAFAMGRKPAIANAVAIASGRATIGDLYVREAV